MIGFAMCGSFCTHAAALEQMRGLLSDGIELCPIFSENVYGTDTRFGRAEDLIREVRTLCGRQIIHTVTEAEPLGPTCPLEALVICPCTGNTLAKLAAGITDTAVTMATKAHLRSDRPLVIALASNDALSANLKNIGCLLNRKSVFFVPMKQDDPVKKPHSLVADFSLLRPALDAAVRGEQLGKIFLS
ncbi:MAG: dipicolinate synthase subunit B [Clostridia bacterium]|nr:dipicolinate synthase subunit B [Clostridia bacterium]